MRRRSSSGRRSPASTTRPATSARSPASSSAIVTEPVTFTLVVVPQNLTVGDWSKNEFTRWMEQQTGIKIQLRQVAGNGDDPETMTKVNAMMAAGDIPDAFLGITFTRSQLYLYGAQNLFVDLDPYLGKYAPEPPAGDEGLPGGAQADGVAGQAASTASPTSTTATTAAPPTAGPSSTPSGSARSGWRCRRPPTSSARC